MPAHCSPTQRAPASGLHASHLDALFEAVDQRDEGFGGGDIGVLLAGPFDQFHSFIMLFAPGDCIQI